ncbi:MAG: hypothetical protein E7591_03215 [Ruminococcaceae bacterium]|nr:hypothetical protein [Oscillospiraceae bacterium]
MAKFCGKCGAPLPEGSDICERCALKGKKPDIEIVRQTPNLKNAQKAIKKKRFFTLTAVVAILLASALLLGGSALLIKNIIDNRQSVGETPSDEELYREILEDIISKKNKKQHEYIYALGLGSADMAYVIKDIDENGTKELLVYSPDDPKSLVYECYTVAKDKALCLIKSEENKKAYALKNGGLLLSWSASAVEWGEDRYVINDDGDGIDFVDRVAFDRVYAEDESPTDEECADGDCYFYTDTAPEKSEYEHISYEEAEDKRNTNEKDKLVLEGDTLDKYEHSFESVTETDAPKETETDMPEQTKETGEEESPEDTFSSVSEDVIYDEYIHSALTLYDSTADLYSDYGAVGVFSALTDDLDGDLQKELITFELVKDESDRYCIRMNLYKIKDDGVIFCDTIENIRASGAGVFANQICAYRDGAVIRIESYATSLGGSIMNNDFYAFSVIQDKIVMEEHFNDYSYYRYDEESRSDLKRGKDYSSFAEFSAALEEAGFMFNAHYHCGTQSGFDVIRNDYRSWEEFKGDHIFTFVDSLDMFAQGNHGFIHDNTGISTY